MSKILREMRYNNAYPDSLCQSDNLFFNLITIWRKLYIIASNNYMHIPFRRLSGHDGFLAREVILFQLKSLVAQVRHFRVTLFFY